MKLRDKETGAIFDDCGFQIRNKWGAGACDPPRTLKELVERFEDVEEPKDYWFIDPLYLGYVDKLKKYSDIEKENVKELGLDFKTKEEAEKAVEKLKAWKRLEDKGFRFKGWSGASGSNNQVVYCDFGKADVSLLNLLFGGEDE